MSSFEPIEAERLSESAERFAADGYRLVQITCVKGGDGALDLYYSFDRDYAMRTLKLSVAPGAPLRSITPIYPGAFLYENEIGELFGVAYRGLPVDFKGTLYDTGAKAPFARTAVPGVSVSVNEAPKEPPKPGAPS